MLGNSQILLQNRRNIYSKCCIIWEPGRWYVMNVRILDSNYLVVEYFSSFLLDNCMLIGIVWKLMEIIKVLAKFDKFDNLKSKVPHSTQPLLISQNRKISSNHIVQIYNRKFIQTKTSWRFRRWVGTYFWFCNIWQFVKMRYMVRATSWRK